MVIIFVFEGLVSGWVWGSVCLDSFVMVGLSLLSFLFYFIYLSVLNTRKAWLRK
jgi:hypothetical protein